MAGYRPDAGDLPQLFLGPLAAIARPSPAMRIYAVAYIPLMLALGMMIFQRRDA